MTLDVIVVSYRSAMLLADCIRAALRFAGITQVVLVDNAPGEGAASTVRAIAPNATIIENDENIGYAAAVNQALAASTGDLVLLLNPDIVDIRGGFQSVIAEFACDERLAAITPRLVGTDGSVEPTCQREPRPFDFVSEWLDLARRFPGWQQPRRFRMLDHPVERRTLVDAATGACLFLRRAAIADVGSLDESFFLYCEETDWLIRAKRRGWKTLYLPEIEAVHLRSRSTEVSRETLLLLLLESQHKYSRKHFGRPTALAVRAILLLIDALRWVRSLAPGHRHDRASVRRRIRVHLTGRAPRPVEAVVR